MFKKPLHHLKTSAPLKSSDRRKLRQRVVDCYQLDPASPEHGALADELVPEGILMAKFSSHSDEHGVLYLDGQGSNDPLWFTIGKGSTDLIPTVYTLWKHPQLLPTLTTPRLVIPKLLGGADLMAPGVVTWMRGLEQGRIVSITEYRKEDQSCPVAVGRMALNSDLIHDEKKGKAVYTLHVEGDELWAMGSKTTAPPIPPRPSGSAEEDVPDTRSGESVVDDAEAAAAAAARKVAQLDLDGTDTGIRAEEDAERKEELAPEEVSKILRSSLIQAIKELPSSLLPITASTLYSTHILPSRPSYVDAATPVDIKHSTFKTLAHFLKASAQEGLIKTKDQKGDVVITHIFLDHPDIIAHVPFHTMAAAVKKVEAKKERDQARNSKPSEIAITELWKGIGSSHLQNLFKAVNKSPSELYGASDLRQVINTYIVSNSLPNPRNQAMIRLDPLLNALLVTAKENVDELRREDILNRLVTKMQPWHSISQNERTVTKKGALSPIQIATKQKQGRKVVTCITHFESFFLEAAFLAEELKVKCAGSTSVSDLPGKQNSLQEVMVQGNHVSIAADLLLSKGIPKKWIEIPAAVKKK